MEFTHLRCGREGARTLVLCSGLGGAQGYWAPHLDALKPQFDLILYDQRGTGANACGLGPTSIADMADDVLEVCDAAGVNRFDLMGHALGGLVGFDLAARAQRRVERVVAINAWPEIDAHTARCFDIRLATLAGQGLEAFAALQMNFLYPPFWIAAHPEKIAAEEAHAVAHFQGAANITHRIGALRDFRLPEKLDGKGILLVASKDDALVDVAQSERLAERLPGSKLVIFTQGGHAMNLTKRDAFEAEVLPFLTAE
ncbi:pyrimidine utilization protein D [Salipiger sp. PrR002]|uniref:pyrimidine utilization protein D n=1 Tax=Salipiger sp. PrR002 TaxID=2706489 RepID=UPI0013B6A663|nr:pyrimidine utilization protein D [Salipiger sp. PrR002]NDV99644.1 pyrimidine utilization protein D [Salipiger sp. PrR002]NDW56758.1 pyrimidine utilization protein D [Salipiger sp. PrR004]